MAQKVTESILYMIAKDNLPLSITEKDGFKRLMKLVVPHYKLPGRSVMTARLDDKYILLQKLVQLQLSQVQSLALTMDIWTEKFNTISYLGITAHYMQEDEIKSCVLGICYSNLLIIQLVDFSFLLIIPFTFV